MRRHRWLVVLGFALVLSGCSGTQLMGVAARPDGGVELRSYCTNEGLSNARIRFADGGVVGTIDATTEGQETVVFPAAVFADLDAADRLTVEADYAGTGFFAESLTIAFGELEPGTVVISGLEPEVVSPAEFEERRVSCGFDATRLALLIGVGAAIVAAAVLAVALPILGGLLYVRRRRRTEVTTF